MTKSYFIANYNTISECIDFCEQNRLDYVSEDIYYEESFEDRVWEEIRDWDECWEYLRDWLDELPSGYDYYRYDEFNGSFVGMSEYEVDDLKEEIIETMDMADAWDDEDEVEDEIEEEIEEFESFEIPSENEIFGLADFDEMVVVNNYALPL